MMFTCSVCGHTSETSPKNWICTSCGIAPRQRALARAVLRSLNLHNRKSISECKIDKSRVGVGVTDHFFLAGMLSLKFSYVNTFYHKFPMLDIKTPPKELDAYADFLTCSDVLEHVIAPVDLSVQGLFKILKRGGELIVSVPIAHKVGDTVEHYPGLQDYRVEKSDDEYRVWGEFDNGPRLIERPKFHGGPGYTLELRRFSKQGFRNSLENAGFMIVEEINEDAESGTPLGTGPIFRAKKP